MAKMAGASGLGVGGSVKARRGRGESAVDERRAWRIPFLVPSDRVRILDEFVR